MKFLLLHIFLTACALADSAPRPVYLQQFKTQNRFDTVSDEELSSNNQDMAILKQFDDALSQVKNIEHDRTTHEKHYGKISAQMTADDSAALFQALRLAAVETLPEQIRKQFWRAVINNVMAQRG